MAKIDVSQLEGPVGFGAPLPVAVPVPVTKMPVQTKTAGQARFVGPVATTTPIAASVAIPAKTPTYGTARIYDRYGNLVTVYTEGPNAGHSVDTGELVIQGEAPAGGTSGVPGSGNNGNTGTSTADAKDAILANTLTSYGMAGIGNTIKQIRADNPEISQDDLLFLLKNDTRYNAEYLKRFAGNAKLKAAGLPTLSDSDYLTAENEYKKIFTAYGATNLANNDYYATLIGNKMDAGDVSDRLDAAYQVYHSSPQIKDAFNTFYGTVTDGDIISAMLDPKTQVPLLQKKVDVAKIGGAALAQGLETSLVKAQDLADYGVTAAQAQSGYTTVAQALPGYQKLLEMKTGGKVAKSDAQSLLEAANLKKNAKALTQEQNVVTEELNRFGGQSGTSRGSFSSGYLNRTNAAGTF